MYADTTSYPNKEIERMVTNAIIFLILLGATLLGYMIRAGGIMILTGLGFIVFGFSLWSLFSWLSMVVVGVGAVVFWQGAKS